MYFFADGISALEGDLRFHSAGDIQKGKEMRTWILAGLMLGANCAPSIAGYQEGKAAIAARDFAQAERELLPLAQRGDPEAQSALGFVYDEGFARYSEAMKWYRKASDQGDAHSSGSIGLMYFVGLGVTKDDTKAISWFWKAVAQGERDGPIFRSIGVLYEEGHGTRQSLPIAYALYFLSYRYDDSPDNKALRRVTSKMSRSELDEGRRLFESLSKSENLRATVDAYADTRPPGPAMNTAPSSGSAEGNASAVVLEPGQNWVGQYRCAQGTTPLTVQITGIMPTADAQQYRVDGIFAFGDPGLPTGSYKLSGTYSPPQQSVRLAPAAWIKQPPGYFAVGLNGHLGPQKGELSGRIDHPSCSDFRLALRNRPENLPVQASPAQPRTRNTVGEPVSPSSKSAMPAQRNQAENGESPDVAALTEKAKSGDLIAQITLGGRYGLGEGVAKDDKQSAFWYRKAAEQGNEYAQDTLGSYYAEGVGVVKDNVQATYWFRKAADQGFAEGQFSLGTQYFYGRGVTKDYTQAAVWFRKAAGQGHPSAQYNLGTMYADGAQGLPKDDAKAVSWYRKAADQGHVGAQNNLGWMYEAGFGVPKDVNEAIRWYTKAAAQGHDKAVNNLRRIKSTSVETSPTNAGLDALRERAQRGDPEAQVKLGDMLYAGRGIAKDRDAGIVWLKEALPYYLSRAERGEAESQYQVGNMLWHINQGPTRETVYWYKKAAAQGHVGAKDALKEFPGASQVAGQPVAQDKLRSCHAEAGTKALTGDERKHFMRECLKADSN